MTTNPSGRQNSSSSGVERRRADDERPELQAEQPVDAPVAPPARRIQCSCRRRLAPPPGATRTTCSRSTSRIFGTHTSTETRRALDLPDDVVRVVAAREDDVPRQHRRHERRHRLAEHVAERQQVQEADRLERPRVLPVLRDLALDRDDVREDVAVRDDDALRLGGRAGREDDLGDVVARDGDGGGGAVGAQSRSAASRKLATACQHRRAPSAIVGRRRRRRRPATTRASTMRRDALRGSRPTRGSRSGRR